LTIKILLSSFREYVPKVFIREYVPEIHGVPHNKNFAVQGYFVLREQFSFNFYNQGVIETLISVISRCKLFLSMSHNFFVKPFFLPDLDQIFLMKTRA